MGKLAALCRRILNFSIQKSRSYVIESIAGKGLGIVATERISKGEKVFEETPLLRGKTQDLRQRLNVAEAVANLSNTKRKRFRALFNSFPEEEDLGIIRTNCYALGTDSVYCGVFRKLSRVNHSCTPNCERWWDSHRDAETSLCASRYRRW